jgi:hypothetical protein
MLSSSRQFTLNDEMSFGVRAYEYDLRVLGPYGREMFDTES